MGADTDSKDTEQREPPEQLFPQRWDLWISSGRALCVGAEHGQDASSGRAGMPRRVKGGFRVKKGNNTEGIALEALNCAFGKAAELLPVPPLPAPPGWEQPLPERTGTGTSSHLKLAAAQNFGSGKTEPPAIPGSHSGWSNNCPLPVTTSSPSSFPPLVQ